MTAPTRARPQPCTSCPYRRDVPAGIWAVEEYAKLPGYDGDINDQYAASAFGVFHCHQAPELICAGWAGCHDMANSLAVRLALAHRSVHPAILNFTTDVPLFASGAEAAAHGLAGVGHPDAAARVKVTRLLALATRRNRRGKP